MCFSGETVIGFSLVYSLIVRRHLSKLVNGADLAAVATTKSTKSKRSHVPIYVLFARLVSVFPSAPHSRDNAVCAC